MKQLMEELAEGRVPDDAVVLTFDDGYRDNHDVLLPILQSMGATATIYVQTGPMKGRLNWLHHYFWALHEIGPHELAERLAQEVEQAHLKSDLRSLPVQTDAAEYEMKRLMKYEVTPADRDAVLRNVFEALGGVDADLARDVYLGPEECRNLDKAGSRLVPIQ